MFAPPQISPQKNQKKFGIPSGMMDTTEPVRVPMGDTKSIQTPPIVPMPIPSIDPMAVKTDAMLPEIQGPMMENPYDQIRNRMKQGVGSGIQTQNPWMARFKSMFGGL